MSGNKSKPLIRDSNTHIKKKIIWSLAFMAINAVAYFFLIFSTGNSVSFYINGVDDVIPFEPGFIWIYLSLFPVMIYTLLWELKWENGFRRTLLGYALFVIISSFCYAMIPSVYPVPPPPNDAGVSGMIISWIHSFDNGNTFPSGHTAFSLITLIGVWKYASPRRRFFYSLWFCGILISTLVLKQHHALDLVAGVAVGTVCSLISSVSISAYDKKNACKSDEKHYRIDGNERNRSTDT